MRRFLAIASRARDPARALFGFFRSLVGLAFVIALVWCSFRVPLGRRTFAEHIDRIGETPEARELVDSTRGTLTPWVEDATDRMLGEHIEAPTALPAPVRPPRAGLPPSQPGANQARRAARTTAPARPPKAAIAGPSRPAILRAGGG